ncbi:unnamed protein product [Rhodiola kirilowii]
MCLQQSRDETLDEYYTNYDTIVSSCPHHGFTKKVLLQKFLRGMRADELTRINEAMRRSAGNLSMADMWNLINDLATATKRIPQADRGMQIEEAGPETDEEDTPEPSEESDMESIGSNEEKSSWDLEEVPTRKEVQNTTENYVIHEEAKRRMGKGPEQNDSSMEHVFAITGQGSPKHQKTRFKELVVKGPSPSQ